MERENATRIMGSGCLVGEVVDDFIDAVDGSGEAGLECL
jgi:hypothetical protein